jgi:hypothetical protein
MWAAEPFHPGELILLLMTFGLLALGLLLFIVSARAMTRLMHRVDHPDEPMPPWWQYRRGLSDFIEDVRNQYRYIRRHGADANVVGFLGGFACIAAGALLAENLDTVLDLLGWRLN